MSAAAATDAERSSVGSGHVPVPGTGTRPEPDGCGMGGARSAAQQDAGRRAVGAGQLERAAEELVAPRLDGTQVQALDAQDAGAEQDPVRLRRADGQVVDSDD